MVTLCGTWSFEYMVWDIENCVVQIKKYIDLLIDWLIVPWLVCRWAYVWLCLSRPYSATAPGTPSYPGTPNYRTGSTSQVNLKEIKAYWMSLQTTLGKDRTENSARSSFSLILKLNHVTSAQHTATHSAALNLIGRP